MIGLNINLSRAVKDKGKYPKTYVRLYTLEGKFLASSIQVPGDTSWVSRVPLNELRACFNLMNQANYLAECLDCPLLLEDDVLEYFNLSNIPEPDESYSPSQDPEDNMNEPMMVQTSDSE